MANSPPLPSSIHRRRCTGRNRLPVWLTAIAGLSGGGVLQAQEGAPTTTEEMATVEVVSARYPEQGVQQSAFGMTSVTREEMARSPQSSLDEVLKSEVPGFSLFRRTGSEVANPTTQGPSLRNIGPNGAGRSLVLLDGVPQNDPFGGWVYWSRLPPALLGNVQVMQGGGAGLFGNNALGGTIYLTRHQPQTLAGEVTAGDRDTYDGTVMSSLAAGPFRISSTLHGQSTDGYPVVREDQRGPVDIQADSRSWFAETAISTTLESGTEITLRGSWFEETRGNGTPYTGNHTEALDLSLGVKGPAGDVQWEGLVYYQQRKFESTFSSVNAERTAETPALDQYEVPADSVGFSLTMTFAGGLPFPAAEKEGSTLIVGVDGRWIEGETREKFRFENGNFLNQREAGGTQWLTGAFAEQTWQVNPDWAVTLGSRADYWQVSDGKREERSIASGASLLDVDYPDRDGVVANVRLGTVYKVNEKLQLRSAAYTGYRVPTLNELYRPFRVRNDITGANDALEPERLTGVEAGFQWEPVKSWKLGATVFWNELRDAVANVTVLNGPDMAPDGTVVPEDGVYRQRQNVDAVTTTGVEITSRWEPAEWISLSAGYLYTTTEVQAKS
ncbi:MAG: TonB-dependent receptor plug domain-containing protein, partial [Verrucomicrobium sp.]